MTKKEKRIRNSKKAFITGVSGQDGYYLAHFLARKKYEVWGLVRNAKDTHQKGWNAKMRSRVHIITGELTDGRLIESILKKVKPDEIYNLAAISDLKTAARSPALTMKVNCKAPGRMLKTVFEFLPETRLFMATSALVFDSSRPPQNERTPFKPENPYAIAKLKLHQTYVLPLREKGLYVSSGFLFSHNSPRRSDLVIYKVTQSFLKVKFGRLDVLELGNLDAVKDWGFAGDYVEAMWKMLQQQKPDDFVIATGKAHTVRELVETTARLLDMHITWRGEGLDEVGMDKNHRVIVRINPTFYRPESGYYLGDISKIKKKLGWRPKTDFRKLVKLMLKHNTHATA